LPRQGHHPHRRRGPRRAGGKPCRRSSASPTRGVSFPGGGS